MENSQEPRRDPGGESVQAMTDLFDVLSDEHRRYALHYLQRVAGRTNVSELVDFVVEVAADRSPPDRERVALLLHHNHLPKLAQSGFIEYDPRNGVVAYIGNPRLEACLDHSVEHDLRALRNTT